MYISYLVRRERIDAGTLADSSLEERLTVTACPSRR